VFFYAVPSDALAGPPPVEEVGAVAATALFGSRAGELITSVIALALVSAVSAMVMAGPRVYAAMAANRALPARLAYYNKRGVPTVAVMAQGVIASLFVLVGDLGSLMRFVSFTLALFAALTVGALFILRRRGMRGAYSTPLYPLTPIVFIAASAWIAFAQLRENPVESLVVVGVLAVGALLYLVFGNRPMSDKLAHLPEARIVDDPDRDDDAP
jgi:APA family basic amino acid/polyamine antiporter